jgi:hypothetical protein
MHGLPRHLRVPLEPEAIAAVSSFSSLSSPMLAARTLALSAPIALQLGCFGAAPAEPTSAARRRTIRVRVS